MHAAGPPGISTRWYLQLHTAGWWLWTLSLLTPDPEMSGVGGLWLIYAPIYGFAFIFQLHASQPYDLHVASVGLSLWLGFLANLAIFLYLPRWALTITPVLPWLPFVSYIDLWLRHEISADSPPWRLYYFFPWAIGITLICAARLALRSFPRRENGPTGGV